MEEGEERQKALDKFLGLAREARQALATAHAERMAYITRQLAKEEVFDQVLEPHRASIIAQQKDGQADTQQVSIVFASTMALEQRLRGDATVCPVYLGFDPVSLTLLPERVYLAKNLTLVCIGTSLPRAISGNAHDGFVVHAIKLVQF